MTLNFDFLVIAWAVFLVIAFIAVVVWLGYLLFDDWRTKRKMRRIEANVVRRMRAALWP